MADLDNIDAQLLAVSDWLEDINKRLRERGFAVLAKDTAKAQEAVTRIRAGVVSRAKENSPS